MNEVLSQWMETVLNFHTDLRKILPQLNSNTREILQKNKFSSRWRDLQTQVCPNVMDSSNSGIEIKYFL